MVGLLILSQAMMVRVHPDDPFAWVPTGTGAGLLSRLLLVRVQPREPYGPVAQWSEQPPFKRLVVGSNPTGSFT